MTSLHLRSCMCFSVLIVDQKLFYLNVLRVLGRPSGFFYKMRALCGCLMAYCLLLGKMDAKFKPTRTGRIRLFFKCPYTALTLKNLYEH